MNRDKPTFSIREIGKVRFYGGILFSLFLSVILYLFFINMIKSQFVGIAMLDGNWSRLREFRFGDKALYFFALFSSSLGFIYASQFWLFNEFPKKRSNRMKVRKAKTQGLHIFYIVLLVLLRCFLMVTGISLDGYGDALKEEYTFIAYLLPTFIFLYNWNMISTVYQSLKAQLISIPIWLGVSYLLSFTYYLVQP